MKLLPDGIAEISEKDIDFERMKFVHKKRDEYFFKKYEDKVITGKNGRHIFFDNGSSVLAVAHLDTVVDPHKTFHFNVNKVVASNGDKFTLVKTPTLDDRLGVYTIMDLLPGILGTQWADILLTEGEESGNSTAQDFVVPEGRTYNWIVEFDRKNSSLILLSHNKATGKKVYDDDIVMYMYGDEDADEIKEAFTDAGFIKIGKGSFTDIAYMQHLECKGFNVAVGYHDNHSTKAGMWVAAYLFNINNFIRFYKKYQGTRFPHKKVVRATYKSYTPGSYTPGTTYSYGSSYGGKHSTYRKAEYEKSGWLEDCYIKPGDIVAYSSWPQRVYVVTNTHRLKSPSKYFRYRIDLAYPEGIPYMEGVPADNLKVMEDVCQLCFKQAPTVMVNDSDSTYINLCRWCYENVIGDFSCASCGISMGQDEVIVIDGYAACEACMFPEDNDEYSRLWPGDWVKFNQGMKIYEVLDLYSNKDGEVTVSICSMSTGEIMTNGGDGFSQDAFTIISKRGDYDVVN